MHRRRCPPPTGQRHSTACTTPRRWRRTTSRRRVRLLAEEIDRGAVASIRRMEANTRITHNTQRSTDNRVGSVANSGPARVSAACGAHAVPIGDARTCRRFSCSTAKGGVGTHSRQPHRASRARPKLVPAGSKGQSAKTLCPSATGARSCKETSAARSLVHAAAPDSIARRRHQHAQTQQAMMRRTTRLSWISASVAAIVRAWASSAPSAALPIVLAKHTQGRQSTCKARSNHSWGGHAVFGAQGVHGKDGPRQPSKQRGASAPRQRFPCIGGAKARRLVAQTGVRARVAAPDEPHRESVDLAPRPTALARSSVASIPMPTPNAAVAAVATLQSGASRRIAELQLASPPRSSFTRRSLWPKCPRLAKIDTRRLPRLDARRRAAAADEHMPLCLCAAPLSAPAWTAISPVHLDRLDRSTARDAAIYALAACVCLGRDRLRVPLCCPNAS